MNALRKFRIFMFIASISLVLFMGRSSWAQENSPNKDEQIYDLRIEKLEIPNASNIDAVKNGFTYDLDVQWGLYVLNADGSERGKAPDSLIEQLLPSVKVKWSTDKELKNPKIADASEKVYRIKGLIVGRKRYFIKIEGQINGHALESDIKSVVHGLASPKKVMSPIPLFFPLEYLGLSNEVYNNSTLLGKAAFSLIWYLLFGGIVVLRKCRIINIKKIFPLNTLNSGFMIRRLNRDYFFETNLTPKMRFIIEAWKSIIDTGNKFINSHLAQLKSNNPTVIKAHRNLMQDSSEAIALLIQLLEFDYENSDQNKLQQLLLQTQTIFGKTSKFYDFVSNGIVINANGHAVQLAWQDITADFQNTPQNSRSLREIGKNLTRYPAAKILIAGLENHLNNIFDWEKASSEVDRAIENRLSLEMENIKEKSSLELLWVISAISPLVGLFGTVTGITNVFRTFSTANTIQDQMMTELTKGIYEALWTTIFGLFVAILMMLIYYLYKTRMEYLQNKMMALVIHITEKL